MVAITTSQTQLLIAQVGLLSEKLARPVCAGDLKAYFRQQPDHIPQLRQRLGQQLIKAARPYRRGCNPIQKIGLIGNQVYYAVGPGSWRPALERHRKLLRMQEAATWRLPERAAALLGTKYEPSARNAIAGFIQEWGKVAYSHQPLAEQVQEARTLAARSFRLHAPADLIGRKATRALLLKLVAKYDGSIRARHFNPNRPPAFLRWPRSALFRTPSDLTYSSAQIRAFARWKAGFEGPERLYLSFYDPTILLQGARVGNRNRRHARSEHTTQVCPD